MVLSITVVIISLAIILAIIINLALTKPNSSRLTVILTFVTIIGGTVLYGVGYAQATGDLWFSLVKTPLSVIMMFVGRNDYSAIANTSIISTRVGTVLFWLFHSIAFYTTASAAIVTIGATALRHLRYFISHKGDVVIIFGVNETTLDVGLDYHESKNTSVVFIDNNPPSDLVSNINNNGMAVFSGKAAVESHPSFIKRLHIPARRITIIALDNERQKNIDYAMKLKNTLELINISPDKTTLILPGEEDFYSSIFQVSDTQYGFGYVNAFNQYELAGRLLVSNCPPWESVCFNEEGEATDSFECVVVGFGRYGQAVLKQLIINAQFVGSSFKGAVFSINIDSESGLLRTECPELFNNYDIQLFSTDGRSNEFYNYINMHLDTLKLVALCTGNDNMNREIAENLMLYLKRQGKEHIKVVLCGKTAVEYQERIGEPVIRSKVLAKNTLSPEKVDRAAILLNAMYDKSDKTDWEKWVSCDSFSKMSSRASAEFIPAFIKASGSNEEELLLGNWRPGEKMLNVLGEMEHARWMAFHYTMGYSPMSEEEFQERAEEYRFAKANNLEGNKRFTKNQIAHTHACLIPWDQLDALSARVSEIIGEEVNYKQSDFNNILAVPNVLKLQKEKAK